MRSLWWRCITPSELSGGRLPCAEGRRMMVEQHSSVERRGRGSLSKASVDVGDSGTPESEPHQEIGIIKSFPRAKWNHQSTLFLIDMLTEYDKPGYRNQNAWSKEAWTHITSRVNQKFRVSYSVGQAKQKEQDLKKSYRSVKDLVDQSGFGWNSDRNMVEALPEIWESLAARKNGNDALQWREKTFPYYDSLFYLYDGRYAEGRTRHGMDHYASKSKNAPTASSQPLQSDVYGSPSPTIQAPGDSGFPFNLEEENEEVNLDSLQNSSTPMQHVHGTQQSTQMHPEKGDTRRGKKQKSKHEDGFHERYLKLKKEEIDRFAAIEEKKMEDPFSISKCITAIEGLDGLQMGDMLMASDIFKNKENREVFLSFSTDERRLAWIGREIARSQPSYQN